jgi:exosortase A-associated hydrolase 2
MASGLVPFFLDGPRGRLFAIRRALARGGSGSDVLLVPPFAEEMNRSRRMLALQMAAFAERGIGSLLVDPYGTGDSEGEFQDLTWDGWREDTLAGLAWLERETGTRVAILGLRLGAMLAAEIARDHGSRIGCLVLWQPVVDGELAMTQMLRLRLAADMSTAGAAGLTTKDLRSRLAAGEIVEVAGYPLRGGLTAAIDRLQLRDMAPPPPLRVDWLEVVAEEGAGPGPASATVIERWRAVGCDVRPRTVVGEQFWSLQETTIAPALLAATTRLVAEAA